MTDQKINPDSINWESALKEMRDEGMNDDAIHKEIAAEFGTTVADQQLGRGKFAKEESSGLEQGSFWPKEWQKVSGNIPWQTPALVTGAALVGHYGPKLINKGKQSYDSLRDLMAAKEEGLLASQQAEKLAASTPAEVSAQAVPKAGVDVNAEVGKGLNPTDTELLKKSESIPAQKQVAKDVAEAEKAMAKGISEGLPPPDLATGTGKPAYAGQADTTKFKSSYAKPQDVPKGYAWVPGAQHIDTPRTNVGQETFTKEFSTRPYPGSYQESVDVSREINRNLNRPTRDQLIEEGKALPENTKGITKAVSKSKLVKVAGVGGALIALSDLALAGEKAKQGEYSEAAKIGVPAAAGLVNPAAGGLTEAAVNPSGAAQQLRGVAPILGTFADVANQKMQQYLKSSKKPVPPPR